MLIRCLRGSGSHDLEREHQTTVAPATKIQVFVYLLLFFICNFLRYFAHGRNGDIKWRIRKSERHRVGLIRKTGGDGYGAKKASNAPAVCTNKSDFGHGPV